MRYPQWYFDQVSLEHATGMGIPKPRKLAQPSFMDKPSKPLPKVKGKAAQQTNSTAQAWQIATSPLKQLPITVASAFFAGNSVQIVTLSLIFLGLLLSPVLQILTVGSTFSGFTRTKSNKASIKRAQLVYVLSNLLAISFGFYKINSMGLLPTRKVDWVSWELPTVYEEYLSV